MSVAYRHCFLRCKNSCAIPLPHSTLEEIGNSLHQSATEIRTAVFVCPYCGLVSEYSRLDALEHLMVDKPNLFQAGECLLVSTEVECGGKNCRAPKTVHAVQGIDTGTWRPKVVPGGWQFDDTANCAAGHKLHFDESARIYWVTRADDPF